MVDAVITVVVTALAQGQLAPETRTWVRLAMLGVTLVVVLRRRAPLLTSSVVAFGVGLMGLQPDAPSVFGEYLAVLVVAFTVAERCALRGAIGGGLLLAAGVFAHDWRSQEYGGVAGIASDLAIPVVIWGLGRVVRLQQVRADSSKRRVRELENERLELARQAVAEERAHLARELHDVVTHSVSVVVIQAQGARRVLDNDHDDVRAALKTIEDAGRSALTDMRRLLGLLRDDEASPTREPQPTLGDLPALVAQVRRAGLPVQLYVDDALHGVDNGVSRSAYRVVQEALTNCLKHAGPAHASVDVRRDGQKLELFVDDDGPGTGAGTDGGGGSGRGLLGMRERVGLYGGTLEAGPCASAGFRVHATFPLEEP